MSRTQVCLAALPRQEKGWAKQGLDIGANSHVDDQMFQLGAISEPAKQSKCYDQKIGLNVRTALSGRSPLFCDELPLADQSANFWGLSQDDSLLYHTINSV